MAIELSSSLSSTFHQEKKSITRKKGKLREMTRKEKGIKERYDQRNIRQIKKEK